MLGNGTLKALGLRVAVHRLAQCFVARTGPSEGPVGYLLLLRNTSIAPPIGATQIETIPAVQP